MKVVQINATCGSGSTGKICVAVSQLLTAQHVENYILYSSGKSEYPLGIKYIDDLYIKLQALKSRILGNYGFNSKCATHRLLRELDRIAPDVVHLHNLHSHNCDLSMLLPYLKEKHIKIYWTFHDCWVFTAYCPHFVFAKCEQWKTGCHDCPQRKSFSWLFDRSATLFARKRELFVDLDLTIITPSKWLTDLVKQSFLKEYPVKIIHNGIDLSVFKPTRSDFRKRYACEDKHLLLGVAFGWWERKGVDVFIELAKRLDDSYKIVLVGTDNSVDKQLPNNIISIHRTQNQKELAEIYTAADLFINPTREEVLGLVNIEALACGTPVVTFKTGGSPEILDTTCGSVVECDDVDTMTREIMRICLQNPYSEEACMKRAKSFDIHSCFREYCDCYRS